jgi:cell division protein FtsQ
MAVKAPDDKHFRRAHAKPVARRRRELLARAWATTRVVLGVTLVAAAAAVGARALVRSSHFTVQRLAVSGNVRLSTDEVTALLAGLRGQNTLRADLATWQERLAASRWVRSAELHRVLPSTVEVEIIERVPLAIGRLNGRLYLLDERGEAIDDYGPQYAELDLPIVDGLVSDRAASRQARAALVARLLGSFAARPELLRLVSQLDVSDPRDAVAILAEDPARVHLGDRDFAARVQAYLELKPALQARVPVIDYVDLRFDSRVFVRPAADAIAPVALADPVREGTTFR